MVDSFRVLLSDASFLVSGGKIYHIVVCCPTYHVICCFEIPITYESHYQSG